MLEFQNPRILESFSNSSAMNISGKSSSVKFSDNYTECFILNASSSAEVEVNPSLKKFAAHKKFPELRHCCCCWDITPRNDEVSKSKSITTCVERQYIVATGQRLIGAIVGTS